MKIVAGRIKKIVRLGGYIQFTVKTHPDVLAAHPNLFHKTEVYSVPLDTTLLIDRKGYKDPVLGEAPDLRIGDMIRRLWEKNY